MIKIDVIHLEGKSNYPVSSSKIVKNLKNFLLKRGVSSVKLVVVITDESEMKRLGKKYLKETDGRVHNVLSFPESEIRGNFVYPPGEGKRLGEIYICYSKAVEEAQVEGKSVDEKIYELAEHGTLHLLGIHHD